MGRDSWRFAQLDRERDQRRKMNPIWRGVGCILIVILTVAGYAFADWFYTQNQISHWIFLPREITNPSFAPFLGNGLMLKIIIAFLFMILSYAIMSVIFAIASPIEPGEHDAPPPKKERVKRKR